MLIFYPMGGTGTRFIKAGYDIPKPLLEMGGKKLIQWALESVKLLKGPYDFYHYAPTVELSCHPLLIGLLPPGCWHIVMEPTAGPLQTLLEAEGCLQTKEELLICDCDSLLNQQELFHLQIKPGYLLGRVPLRKLFL